MSKRGANGGRWRQINFGTVAPPKSIERPLSIDFLNWAEIMFQRIQVVRLRSPLRSFDFCPASTANPCDDSWADPRGHELLSFLPSGTRLHKNHVPDLKILRPQPLVVFPDHVFICSSSDSLYLVSQTRQQFESIFQLRGCLHELVDLGVVFATHLSGQSLKRVLGLPPN